MTDYGTIKIDRSEYEQHNERRKDMGLTWSEYINGESPDVSNDAEGVDYERLGSMMDEKLQYHLAEWEITVNMDQLDLDSSDMNEDDVRTIVESEIDQLKREMR